MKLAYGGILRQSQIDELRTMAQDPEGKIEVVFLLDAYDELPSACKFKNLYATNNLETYRSTTASSECFPKLIITSRSELFSGQENYSKSFLPIEMQNEKKDEAAEVQETFQELRIIDFSANRKKYILQHVALQTRQMFVKAFDMIEKAPHGRDSKLWSLLEKKKDNFILTLYEMSTIEQSNRGDDFHDVGDASVVGASYDRWLEFLGRSGHKEGVGAAGETLDDTTRGCALLAALTGLKPDEHASSVAALVGSVDGGNDASLSSSSSSSSSSSFASTAEDEDHFENKIPELKELTSTPFMLRVVVQILPLLSKKARRVREMKSSLVVTLGEGIAEVVWALLNGAAAASAASPSAAASAASPSSAAATAKNGKNETSLLDSLDAVQRALDAGPSKGGEYARFRSLISKVAAAAAERVQRLAEKHPDDWLVVQVDGRSLEELFSGSSSSSSAIASLEAVIEMEIFRVLKREPTTRASM